MSSLATPAAAHSSVPERRILAVWWLVVVAPMAVIAYGLPSSGILTQPVWAPQGLELLGLFGAAYIAGSVGTMWLVPRFYGVLLTVSALLFGAWSVGAGPVAALLAFLAAAQAAGDLIVRKPHTPYGEIGEAALRLAVGIALYACLTSLLVYFPVNYQFVYWVFVAIPVVLGRRELRASVGVWIRPLVNGPGPGELGSRAASAVLGLFLLMHYLVTLKPEVSFDGLAMHLYAPAYVATHHRWPFDTAQVVWAAMPMGGDWAYTFLYMIGGEYAARLLNFAVMTILVTLLVGFVRPMMSRATALLLASAFVSSPVVQLVTGSMFIDNFLALWLFAVFVIAVRPVGPRDALVASLLLGVALQTKFGALPGVVFLAALVLVSLWRGYPRGMARWAVMAVACIGVLIAAGMPPYATGWATTGNPLYPFTIPSLGMSGVLNPADTPFHEPLRWTSLYDLTFDSGKYLESQNGGFGLHYLLLAPIGLAGAVLLRNGAPVLALAAGLIPAVAVYLGSSYIRYLYPYLPLVVAGSAGAIGAMERSSRRLAAVFAAAVVVLAAINLYLLPASGWYHKQFFLPDLRSDIFRRQYMAAYRPIGALNAYLKAVAPGAAVAYLGTNQIAEAPGAAYTLTWHHNDFALQIARAVNVTEVERALIQRGVGWVVAAESTAVLPGPVQDFVRVRTTPRFRANGWEARQLIPTSRYAAELLNDGEFERGAAEWSVSGFIEAFDGKVRVMRDDAISQPFAAEPAGQYLYSVTAQCTVTAAQIRLEVKWSDAAGSTAGETFQLAPCGLKEDTYAMELRAPARTASGVVIVRTDGPGTAILERVSLKR